MHNGEFQLNKVRRAIRTQGRRFEVVRPKPNKFNEPTQDVEVCAFVGIFHETTEYKSKTSSDASTMRQRSAPMVLALWEDVQRFHHMDLLNFNGKSYRINEIKNFAEANLVADISLEEVQT